MDDPSINIVDWRRFVVVFLLICTLFVLRRPDALWNPQFWAEDGALLFQSQLIQGGWLSAFQPYRGYVILESRLAAAFASLFPIGWAPLVYNLISIPIEGLACSLFSLPWYAHLIRSYTLRVAVCVAAAGALYTESLVNNLCNAQWYLAIACLLLLFRQPAVKEIHGKLLTALCGLVVAVGALTNPVLVVTVPVCLWQIVVRRRNRAVAAALLTGILGQVACFFIAPPLPAATAGNRLVQIDHLVGSLVTSTIYRVVIASMAGWKTANMLSASDAVGMFLSILTAAVVWLTWLWLRLTAMKRVHLVTALYIGTATLIMPLRVRGLSAGFMTVTHIGEARGEQYFVAASFLFLFLLGITAESLCGAKRPQAATAFFLLLVTGGFLENFRAPALPDFHWRRYLPELEAWSRAHEAGTPTLGLSVPTNPQGWSIQLPASLNSLAVSGFPRLEDSKDSAESRARESAVRPNGELMKLWSAEDAAPDYIKSTLERSASGLLVHPTYIDPQLSFRIKKPLNDLQAIVVRARFSRSDRIDLFFGKQVDGRGVSGVVPGTNRWFDVYFFVGANPYWRAEAGSVLRFDPASALGVGSTIEVGGIWGFRGSLPADSGESAFYPTDPPH